MFRLLFLAGCAAAQIPVRLQLMNQDDFEDVLQIPASQVSPQGLVIVQRQTQTFTSSSPLGDLVQTFFGGFRPAPQEFLVSRYDDDASEETHDFGCPCGADVQKLCPGNEGDDLASVFETRLCLARAKDLLSDACFEHLAEAPTVVEYCADDIARGCRGVAPGGNRVHACLAAQEALSGPCGRYVASVGPAVGAKLPDEASALAASDLVRSAFSLMDAFAARHAADDEVLEKADDWGARGGFLPQGGPYAPDRAARPWSPFGGRYKLGRPVEDAAREPLSPEADWTNHLGLFGAVSRAAARDQPDNRPASISAPPPAPLAARGWAPAATFRGGGLRGDQAPDWQELEATMEERFFEEEEAAEEAQEEAQEEQDERVAALAYLLLALAFLGLGMAAFVLSYVAAYAMRKRHERAEVEAFKAKFAPLMKEAPESP
mmetsp:Transcript_10902/g.32536  ORF Transcript_10902/g.32536 Transcript_10902/m.32536 type:complete len:433 (+) Transcript_10902:234-1532(+)|eukprot:CAMPEP_0119260430 /NCGR_PEP_ID=MMETSP1329-20130426/815_1 /TAXON_ID=114041 /ORGANISM="Genus nov. species nov., Strain RCC1024" /LENGTH=432 /DNA_ID=CAMNT_0007259853 /DNA_START=227 /DNA_END=1525 /DNA_ORIENTATION=-